MMFRVTADAAIQRGVVRTGRTVKATVVGESDGGVAEFCRPLDQCLRLARPAQEREGRTGVELGEQHGFENKAIKVQMNSLFYPAGFS